MTDQEQASPTRADADDPTGDRAREIVAKYAFRGPGVELDLTLPLREGEQSIIAGRVVTRYRGHGLPYRRGFLRLSTERLCIVRGYGFQRDRVIEIPRAAITNLSVDKPPLRVGFRGASREEEIKIAVAAETSRSDSRGAVTQSIADVRALQRGGVPSSLRGIGVALASWWAHADESSAWLLLRIEKEPCCRRRPQTR